MDSEIIAAIIGFGGAILGSAITFLAAQIPLNYSRRKELAEKQESVWQKIIQLKKDELNTYQEELNQCIRIESEVKKVERSCVLSMEADMESEEVLLTFCRNISNYNPNLTLDSIDSALCELRLMIEVYRIKNKSKPQGKEDSQKSVNAILQSARALRGLCTQERLSVIAKITRLQTEILHLEADCVKNYVDLMHGKKRKKSNRTQQNSANDQVGS